MAECKLFEEKLKDQQFIEVLNSNEGSIVFQLKEDEIVEEENKLSDAYERELMERFYNIVPQEIKNPCPVEVSFLEFRNNMTKINEQIYKKIIKSGDGAEVDMERTTVSYEYAMFLEAAVDPFDSSVLNKKPGMVSVKDGIEPTPGCYLALASMAKGEEAVFWISSDLMFGKLGCPPRVPPAADMLFSAKILSLNTEIAEAEDEQGEVYTSFQKLFKEAAKNHNLAIEQFRVNNFSKAIQIYRKWIEKLENVRMKSDEEEGKQKRLLIKMYQNVSVCYNKIEKPEKTCIMIRELEKLKPIGNNPKALYAKGKANMMLNNFREARRYFMVAERLTPNDTSVSNMLRELTRRETAKLNFETEQEELARKFQSEALQIAEKKQKRAEKQRQVQKELNCGLEKFKEKLEEKIEALRKDDAIESLNVTTDFAISHHHIEAADKMCQQQQIQLKGTQMTTGDKTLYYLKK